MEKKITDKLITDKLEAKGYLEYHDMDETKVWDLLEEHYECKVTDQWGRDTYDFYCYSESTADGYEVFITTNDPNRICIGEDVHYYENDLQGEIEQAILDGSDMYIDDLDSGYFMYAVEACYDKMYDNMKEEIENELIEQGYEHENTDEATAEMV
jgi:hypothetical protein